MLDLLIGFPLLLVAVNVVVPDPLLGPPLPYPEILLGFETDVLVLVLFMALDDFMAAVAFTGDE